MMDESTPGAKPDLTEVPERRKRATLPVLAGALVGVLLVFGFLLRMIDLKDPPLDFHADRQLRSAVIARGMYYQMSPSVDAETRSLAIALWDTTPTYEPEILERLTALVDLAIGAEAFWVGRLLASLFWTLGGFFLFLLARRLTSQVGALIGLAYYLLLPFGVVASRSFQPDPLMVTGLLVACYALYRFAEEPSWAWAVAFGMTAGIALLVKPMAVFPLGVAAVAICLVRWKQKVLSEPKVWFAAALVLLIPASYYLLQTGERSAGMFSYFVAQPLSLLTRPSFYAGWARLLNSMFGLTFLVISLIGPLLLRPRGRALLGGLWIGYLIYGLAFAYLIQTHDYYSLMLVPIVALSLASVAGVLADRMREQPRSIAVAAAAVVILGFAPLVWNAVDNLLQDNFRGEPAGWAKIGEAVPTDGPLIALTQEYGYRLMYYGWRQAEMWPYQADLRFAELRGDADDRPFSQVFADRTAGARYFLVTHFGEYEQQPELKAHLESHFPVVAEGDGFVLFDLSKGTD
jgi:MFS family permease